MAVVPKKARRTKIPDREKHSLAELRWVAIFIPQGTFLWFWCRQRIRFLANNRSVVLGKIENNGPCLLTAEVGNLKNIKLTVCSPTKLCQMLRPRMNVAFWKSRMKSSSFLMFKRRNSKQVAPTQNLPDFKPE